MQNLKFNLNKSKVREVEQIKIEIENEHVEKQFLKYFKKEIEILDKTQDALIRGALSGSITTLMYLGLMNEDKARMMRAALIEDGERGFIKACVIYPELR
jgi:hypothetical protein